MGDLYSARLQYPAAGHRSSSRSRRGNPGPLITRLKPSCSLNPIAGTASSRTWARWRGGRAGRLGPGNGTIGAGSQAASWRIVLPGPGAHLPLTQAAVNRGRPRRRDRAANPPGPITKIADSNKFSHRWRDRLSTVSGRSRTHEPPTRKNNVLAQRKMMVATCLCPKARMRSVSRSRHHTGDVASKTPARAWDEPSRTFCGPRFTPVLRDPRGG